jgi:hypothetical protein
MTPTPPDEADFSGLLGPIEIDHHAGQPRRQEESPVTTAPPAQFADDLGYALATFDLDESEQQQFREAWDANGHLRGSSVGLATLVEFVKPGAAEFSRSSSEPGPEGDDFGRVPLDPSQDPDELLVDPLALRKAWRAVREEGLVFGVSFEQFEAEWRLFVDLRLDLVETRRREKAKKDAQEEAFKAHARERPAREAAEKEAAKQRAREELEAEKDEYASYVAELATYRKRRAGVGPDTMPIERWRRAGKPSGKGNQYGSPGL